MKRFFVFAKHHFSIFLVLSFFLLFTSCKKEKIILEHTFEIPEQNWDFNQRVLSFEGNIEASPDAYAVVVDVEHVNLLGYPPVPITLSITSPDGSESARPTAIVFDKDHSLEGDKIRTVVYPEKYFNTSGTYQISLYRYHEKFDFNGIKSVSVKIVKKPQEK